MDELKENEPIKTNELPINQVYKSKAVFQFKQPADTDKPLDEEKEEKENPVTTENIPEDNKTSKGEGLNEAKSSGNAGAFEGFEDQD